MKRRTNLIGCLLFLLFVTVSFLFVSAFAQQQTTFQGASNAISSAYSQIYKIVENGGNATSLAAELNIAISLYNKAEAENTSNPSQAALDIQNATQIANSVESQALPLAQKAQSQRMLGNSLVITESIVVIVGAALVYFFGDRVYDSIWLYQHRDYVVESRKNG